MGSQEVFDLLNKHNITYQTFSHPAILTSEDGEKYLKDKNFAKCKCLFIKTRNNKNYFLVMLPDYKKMDWHQAQAVLETSHLTMANKAELLQMLNCTPVSVSPFSLFNDHTNTIQLVIDQEAIEENSFVGVHPNDNTKTISLQWTELTRILGSYGHLVEERLF